MSNAIRQDDEKLRGIEKLARAEKFASELGSEELRATARCAVSRNEARYVRVQ